MPLGRELRLGFQGRRDPWNQGVRGNMAKAGPRAADHFVPVRMNLRLDPDSESCLQCRYVIAWSSHVLSIGAAFGKLLLLPRQLSHSEWCITLRATGHAVADTQ